MSYTIDRYSQPPESRSMYQSCVSASVNGSMPQTPPRIIGTPACVNPGFYRRPKALLRQLSAPSSQIERGNGVYHCGSSSFSPLSPFQQTYRVTRSFNLPGTNATALTSYEVNNCPPSTLHTMLLRFCELSAVH